MALFKKKKVKHEDSEVRQALANLASIQAPVTFSGRVGDTVKILNGPFEGLNASVLEVMHERNMVRLSVDIYGRPVPIEQHFKWVEVCR